MSTTRTATSSKQSKGAKSHTVPLISREKKAGDVDVPWKLIKRCPLNKLREYDRNPRNNDHAVPAVVKSIERFGFLNPIIIDQTFRICAGHTRYKAATQLHAKTVPVIQLTLSETDFKALNIVDNQSAAIAVWAEDELRAIVSELKAEPDFDVSLLAFNEKQLMKLLQDADATDVGDDDEQPIPDVPTNPATKLGTLWLIGEHRLLCGDSTDPRAVARLMGGASIDLIFTSPPYNVNIKYDKHNDNHTEWPKYASLLKGVVAAFVPQLGDGRMMCWNIGPSRRSFWWRQVEMIEGLGLDYIRHIVWDKMVVPMPNWVNTEHRPYARNYCPNYRHEFVFIFGNGKVAHGEKMDTIDSLVSSDIMQLAPMEGTKSVPTISAQRPQDGRKRPLKHPRPLKAHPAVFPIRLVTEFANVLTAKGETIADPFCGAGSSLIAAERMGRIGYGMELSPAYCDVTIERFERMTGLKAKRIKA